MQTDALDYHLPAALIADRPAEHRTDARLLVADRSGRRLGDRHIADLPQLLNPGDLLVLNQTKVVPARFYGRRLSTGGKIEGLYLSTSDDRHWQCMLQSGGQLQVGERIGLHVPDAGIDEHVLTLQQKLDGGLWYAALASDLNTAELLDLAGRMPLPPYIRKRRDLLGLDDGELANFDRERYQTVFARDPGAVAAPTAGLHLSDRLLAELTERGVQIERLTLHVGIGTFQPVRSTTLDAHPMHREWFSVPASTCGALADARRQGRAIVAVGTTVVRALESLPDPLPIDGYAGETDILIQPGFELRWTDGLLTNFHLPRSTLLALVAGLIGLESLKALYRHAIDQRYRFYSYGDAMLILPTGRTTR